MRMVAGRAAPLRPLSAGSFCECDCCSLGELCTYFLVPLAAGTFVSELLWTGRWERTSRARAAAARYADTGAGVVACLRKWRCTIQGVSVPALLGCWRVWALSEPVDVEVDVAPTIVRFQKPKPLAQL